MSKYFEITPFSPYWWHTMGREALYELNRCRQWEKQYLGTNEYYYNHWEAKRKRAQKVYDFINMRMRDNYNYIPKRRLNI